MNSEQAFTLTVDLRRPRLVLSRRDNQSNEPERLLTLEGDSVARLMPAVGAFLHNNGRQQAQLEAKGWGRYRLREAQGARVALGLWALWPIQKSVRATLVREGILSMSDEEVYFWFSRVKSRGGQALKALRILLAGE